jgi:8-oxo-dGTP pyrophosphatase MutT (NUDIX family)
VEPIASYGVICFRWRAESSAPEYLFVQRKDSLSYVEFIRGKYTLQNRGYLARLLQNMTPDERQRLATCTFDALWTSFWLVDHSRAFVKEYHQSRSLFDALRRGYRLRLTSDDTASAASANAGAGGDDRIVPITLDALIAQTRARYDETEWGFPKGRRNINETDIRCACREFREETGVDIATVTVANVRPFEETFTGSNRVRYRHVYYMAQVPPPPPGDLGRSDALLNRLSPVQQREIRAVAWFDFDGINARIRPENVERREMFGRAHAWVLANRGGGRQGA